MLDIADIKIDVDAHLWILPRADSAATNLVSLLSGTLIS
jgi:hypothetical protein